MQRILIQYLLCYTITFALQNNFSINDSKSIESIVLSKIVGNLVIKYLSDAPHSVSIVASNFKIQNEYILDDFLTNFLTEINLSAFDYNINDEIQSNVKQCQVFNLILIDNYELLR